MTPAPTVTNTPTATPPAPAAADTPASTPLPVWQFLLLAGLVAVMAATWIYVRRRNPV